jgi:hypothetical protein
MVIASEEPQKESPYLLSEEGRALHRIVYYEAFPETPKDWCVHHIDGNKKNNDLANLIAMPKPLHSRIHCAEIRNLGDVKWLATEDGKTGKGLGRHIACFILDPQSKTRQELEEENERLKKEITRLSGLL